MSDGVLAFTPGSALLGGALIGLAASLLWVSSGRTAGMSGIFGGVLRPAAGDVGWRASFLTGLVLAGTAGAVLEPTAFGASPLSAAVLVFAGLCVGFGTRLGAGCTSGHGVCGISRGSVRSLVATGTFMASAMITVAVAHAWAGTW